MDISSITPLLPVAMRVGTHAKKAESFLPLIANTSFIAIKWFVGKAFC